jgi:hypothetical protein
MPTRGNRHRPTPIGPDESQRRSVVLGRRLCPTKRDLLLANAGADRVDQLIEVGDELLDRDRRSRNGAVKGLARAAPVPIDNGESFLQRSELK